VYTGLAAVESRFLRKHMDPKQLKQFETLLLEEKRKLEEELSQFAKQNPQNSETFNAEFPDLGEKEDENASEVAEYSKNLTVERTLESSHNDVKKALDRVKEGTYGVCKYCGKDIGEKRLMARPTSTSCIDCKKLFTE
jgi:RNA polymerase-binding protein DksA